MGTCCQDHHRFNDVGQMSGREKHRIDLSTKEANVIYLQGYRTLMNVNYGQFLTSAATFSYRVHATQVHPIAQHLYETLNKSDLNDSCLPRQAHYLTTYLPCVGDFEKSQYVIHSPQIGRATIDLRARRLHGRTPALSIDEIFFRI